MNDDQEGVGLPENTPSAQTSTKKSPNKKMTFWEALVNGFNRFIWTDLREGMIDLRGLPRLVRGVIRLGFVLLGIVLLAILFSNYIRSRSSLIPLLNSSTFAPERGVLLPSLLAPLTLVCITFAWTFILSGAIHSHLAARIGILFLYLLSASWQVVTLIIVATTMKAGASDFLVIGAELFVVALIPVLFIVLASASLNPVIEFSLLLFFTALTYFIPQIRSALLLRHTGWPLGQLYLAMGVQDLFMIVLPLLLQIGFAIADFTRQASGWLAGTTKNLLPRWGPAVILFLMLGWRIYSSALEEMGRISRNGAEAELLEYAGALGILVCVALVSMLVRWLNGSKRDLLVEDEEVAVIIGKKIFLLIMIFEAPFLLNYLLGGLGRIILVPDFVRGVLKVANIILDNLSTWYQVVAAGAICVALWRARRGERVFSLYMGMFGFLYLYYHLTGPKEILAALEWRGILPVNLWWLILLAGVSVFLLVRKQLTLARSSDLAFLVFITFFVGETDFIEDPFSPIFGFAGVGFIVFGIIWDTLTRGGWVNNGTHAFSRTSRVFLYLGYVILTATLVNWALSTHDLPTLNALTGKAAMAGFERFGKPMLYVIYVLTLSKLFISGERFPEYPLDNS